MKSPASSCSCFFSLYCSHLHPFSIVAFCLACRSFVNATTIHYTTILFPFPPYASVDLPPLLHTAPQGYKWHFSFSCTRFPSDFLLKSGTDDHFPSPVPGFRPISCSNRVQTTIFLLLYPFSVVFPTQIGYRRPFSCSCTRSLSFFLLKSGTDDHFPSPVPVLCRFSCSNRVQITLFPLLYPCRSFDVLKSASPQNGCVKEMYPPSCFM